jgi:hypothetical protein
MMKNEIEEGDVNGGEHSNLEYVRMNLAKWKFLS